MSELPFGYRWALEEDLNRRDGINVPMFGSLNIGFAVPWDCMVEFGMDHDHDPVECERILADMNPEIPDEREYPSNCWL